MVLNLQRIRPGNNKGLIFFCSRLLWIQTYLIAVLSCTGHKEISTSIEIVWEKGRPTALIVPAFYLEHVPTDSINHSIKVYLNSSAHGTAILGDYQQVDEGVIFRPLIAFTPGLTYEVSVSGKTIGSLEVSVPDHKDFPTVTEIFPSQDTLPENLLKFYLRFSHPMREGQALTHITLLKDQKDTVRGTFLDLQPELWNKDYTLLTLWLDPGRIKRELQPNQRLGVPLEPGVSYSLVVGSDWPDTRGEVIREDFRKEFFVGARDSIRPDVKRWLIKSPKANTMDPLVIQLHESLDRILLSEAVRITSERGDSVSGKIETGNEEAVFQFIPDSPWVKGTYTIECEERLEDLAGNNLNRLFDRDLTKDPDNSAKEIFAREFTIQ